MDQDPYYQVKSEVENALESVTLLSGAYTRDSNDWTLSELRAALSAIKPDIEELEESVQAIEEPGVARRLGIEMSEVRERKEFLRRVKQEISDIRRKLPVTPSRSPSPEAYRSRYNAVPPPSLSTYKSSDPLGPASETDLEAGDPNAEFEMQHQSLLMEQQDRTLTDIAGTVNLLREQARVIGTEVYDQNRMIDELDQHVDSTSSRLAKAQRKMDKFMRDNSNSPSSWFVLVLIIVLCILLFLILFT
ncbi:uncharacterized protein JCM6883_000123 [Sporobolomyces salmoneus]|uniref:uncharacterized protein n=1 Tax=Sporobolomyces salmoneus TaxID=183962 RepID=UPI00317B5B53